MRAAFAVSLLATVWHVALANAGPALLIEPATGLVLYGEDADAPWRPASLTKLMTLYITFEAIRDGKLSPEDSVICSQGALKEPPSRLGLPLGSELKVDYAIKALIVKSANDVAVMLAEKIGGTQEAFVETMNKTAKRLGMTNTTFVNANGLPVVTADDKETPAQAVTTARDMALLAAMILKEFPQYGELFGLTNVAIGTRVLTTHNSLLLTYAGADGMKTGFVCASGYNLVASASRDGRRLVAVILGENSDSARTLRAAALFEYGFAMYPWKAVFATTLAASPVAAENASPPDMHGVVCNGHPAAAIRKTRADPQPAVHRKAVQPRRRKRDTSLTAAQGGAA